MIIWYRPMGFPTVLTDAPLVRDNGDTLVIFNGFTEEIITRSQVERIVGARAHESAELLGKEINEFDSVERGT